MNLPLAIVVEDDPEICQLFVDMLPMTGFAVIGFHTHPSARTVLFSGAPDILVIDMMLNSDTDGVEYARIMRERGLTCPMVAVSASDHQLASARASELFVACVRKPLDMWKLAGELKRILGLDEGDGS